MKTRINTTKLKELAIKEAKALKKYATEEQIASLDANIFDPDSPTRCIYGMATGNCFNGTAENLIKKCASRIYEIDRTEMNKDDSGRLFDYVRLNGTPEQERLRSIAGKVFFFSPIEVLIDRNRKAGLKIIDYLKGKTKKLVL